MDKNDDYSGPGLPLMILLHPKEVIALDTLSGALATLHHYYRPTNRGKRDADSVSDATGRRDELTDALQIIELLGNRMREDQVKQATDTP